LARRQRGPAAHSAGAKLSMRAATPSSIAKDAR
jgi:hypothetical protein